MLRIISDIDKSFLIASVIFAVLSIVSCDRYSDTLVKVDSLLENNLHRADSILASIDSSSLTSSSDKALYRLLSDEISYKKYQPSSTGSSLDNAIDYFRRSDDKNHLMRALYMKSIAEFEYDNPSPAIRSASDAESLAFELDDNLYLARVREHMAYIFNENLNPEQEYKYLHDVPLLYGLAGRKLNQSQATVSKALSLYNLRKYEESLSLLDSAISVYPTYDLAGLIYAYENRVRLLLELNRNHEASKTMNIIYELNKDSIYNPDISLIFKLALVSGNIPYARALLDSITERSENPDTDGRVLIARYLYFYATGDVEKALAYMGKVDSLKDATVISAINQSIMTTQKDYLQHKEQLQKKKFYGWRKWSFLLTAFLLLIIFTVTAVFLYRNRHNRKIIQKSQYLLLDMSKKIKTSYKKQMSLSDELEKNRKHMAEMSENIRFLSKDISEKEVFIGRLKTLQSSYIRNVYNDLYRLIFEYHQISETGSEKLREHIKKSIDRYIETIRKPSSLRKIQEELDLLHGDVITQILKEYPRLRKDSLFITLLLSGFGSKSICLICDITIENYYTKKSRFVEKTEKFSSSLKEHIMFLLNGA